MSSVDPIFGVVLLGELAGIQGLFLVCPVHIATVVVDIFVVDSSIVVLEVFLLLVGLAVDVVVGSCACSCHCITNT
jgi:hypothetical protein